MSHKIPNGFRVEYNYIRPKVSVFVESPFFEGMFERRQVISPKGGTTIASVRDEYGNLVASGRARCAKSDRFVKRIGRDIALGRALEELEGWLDYQEAEFRERIRWAYAYEDEYYDLY